MKLQTVQKYEQQITELTNQITILNNELTSVKDSASISKQLINKLNQDIEVLETNKDNIQQRLNDKTSETETLKTRIQELSITNKHYLSQLQNKLDKSQYEVTELLRKCNSLQKSKNEIEDTLQTELKESRDEVFLLKTETNQQKETIDKQNEVIETYKQQQISEEEYKASVTKDRQMNRYHYPDQGPSSLPTHSIGPNTKPPVIEQPWKCLFCGDSYPSERERDIHMTDSCNNAPKRDDQSIVTQHRPPMGKELETKLTQSERDREDLERKLGELARELADRDSRIQELSQPVVIPQSRGQVPKSPSTPVMPTNPKLEEKNKSQSRWRDSKSRFPEPSAGATSGATNMNLTPEVIPQANKTGKSSAKMIFRGVNIPVIKLKAFPNPTESYNKQVIYPINKRYELGKLMYIAELPAKGFMNAVPKYAGIQLYSPVGNCDGTYKDKRYFECPPNYRIFVPLEDVYVPVP